MQSPIVPMHADTCSTDTFYDTRLPVADRGAWRRKPAQVTYSREHCKAVLGFCDMLTPDGYNPKTKKGRARGYATAILHLAPHKLSGANLCPDASAGCIAGCLNLAGHGGINLDALGLNAVQRARIARSVAMRKNRFAFKAILKRAIEAHIRRALRKGLIPVVRLNGTSDVPWEHYKLNDGRTVFETFPTIQFYDYTKSVERALANARGEHPANYHLTFSRSETNELDCERVLNAGGNVAIVANICACKCACKHEFPDGLTYHGRPVVKGDHDDLRFLDPAGVVVGLKAKGPAKRDTSGFVVALDAFGVTCPAHDPAYCSQCAEDDYLHPAPFDPNAFRINLARAA